MMHKLSVLLVVVVVFAIFAGPAAAGPESRPAFCSSDPIFDMDGHTVNVVVELAPYQIKYQITAHKPVGTVLTHPKKLVARLICVGGDFPEEVKIKESGGDEAAVSVRVPKLDGFEALRVTVYIDGVLVAQDETTHPHLFLSFDWAGDR